MQVAGFELHAGAEQLVDLEVGIPIDEATFEGVVFGHGKDRLATLTGR
jgi:hypothetical protein